MNTSCNFLECWDKAPIELNALCAFVVLVLAVGIIGLVVNK